MRLWSLHPQYLDSKGLVALWREGLLAQAVLAGLTRGYRQHPQLQRFRNCARPELQIAQYLQAVQAEAVQRGYNFDRSRIRELELDAEATQVHMLPVTRGQLTYEWAHLRAKLVVRAPERLAGIDAVQMPQLHPSFRLIEGPVESWEVIADRSTVTR